ncbi:MULTISPECIES: Rid family detoxifying hydrolase [Pontibacillus]|uniref:Rid family detoxifying hydrolase n=1 Tax=Pontibacillus chungwhensis TaxID=265426 RepID=A0ABY8UYI4_9BACI|nr:MULTISPECIES: Rid family detoxifying hydrolase [Pontibacillus]MCD5325427.1 Rid family detoxifying hydrolase [Pontibacillus sp. HN14]WIF98542.1 Rid family detoxifying hydrolase [Pontibacillus chungwhensis]
MVKAISTNKAPEAIGPYSQAIDLGQIVFVSGQIPLNPSTMEIVSDDVSEQTTQVMKNVGAILEEAGLNYAHIAKANIYLASMEDFQTVNEVYASFLQEPYPARAAIEVSRLPKDVKVEVEVVAHRSDA